ncbi:hypothetical protein JCM10207_006903 [Rhodosporidiobolus poonsookiae]
MDDSRETKRAQQSSPKPQDEPDRLTKLPPEILHSIFTLIDDAPPLLSHALLPYTRAALFHTVHITSLRQLEAFHRTLCDVPGVGGLVRRFLIGLVEGTEVILAKEKPSLRELLLETIALMPAVKEVQSGEFLSTSVLISDGAATGATLRSMRILHLAILLTQLNATDFITYRLSLLSRYSTLRQLKIMVLPYDPGSNNAVAVDLFPATEASLPTLDMQPISHIEHLSLGGPLCDQRVTNVLRAFSSLQEVALYDSFASRHIGPVLAALDPTRLRSLRLQRLITTPPPTNLPAQEPDWSRFTALTDLFIGAPNSLDALVAALPSLPHLESLHFGPTSDPSAAHVHHLLTHRPAALRSLTLSHLTGNVGAPVTSSTLPSVLAWLAAMDAALSDPTLDAPPFPLEAWRLPSWTPDFPHSVCEALFPLARSVGVELGGTAVSACLTTYVLERMLDVWQSGAVEEMSEEERGALEKREFWDALALRYRARLLGEDGSVRGEGEARVEDSMDMA